MPFISPCSHHLLVPVSIFHGFVRPCTRLRELPRYKNDHWSLSVTLHWIYNYKCQTKVFWMAKQYLAVIIILFYSWNTAAFSALEAWEVSMFSHFYFKCWDARERLLNSWNGYQKLHINRLKWSYRKIIFESTSVWASILVEH